uniref:Zinc finger protein 830 n=1 Tax=Kalanchoe fedtschenkoi TaxID=63787 RepID=A0A7N0UP92_KALFE
MDKKKNALFRAKLEERKKNQVKRIDHPLIRYNDNDQPVCKVCDLALKSDLLWDAHQVSARHHQAIKNLKGSAARVTEVNSVKPKHQTEQLQLKTDSVKSVHPNVADTEKSGILEQGPSHTLPADFFDNSKETKRQKTGNISAPVAKVSSHDNMGPPADRTPAKAVAPEADAVDTAPTPSTGSLPAGFFDNKDADLRARGIKPVKPNVNDEYKEFEKLIQDDLQEVDNRLEEEEIDAAEMIEIAETLEQREKVERLKNLKMKVAEAKSSASKQEGAASRKVTVDEESSSDSDGDYDDSTVDWRAQHL